MFCLIVLLQDKKMKKEQADLTFLHKHYKNCRNYVAASRELCFYADEKFRHSMQVVGAGNYLLKHEKTFQNWSQTNKYLAWQGCLFHDIGRFTEIYQRYDNHDLHGANLRKYDHGEFSYEILKIPRNTTTPFFFFLFAIMDIWMKIFLEKKDTFQRLRQKKKQ